MKDLINNDYVFERLKGHYPTSTKLTGELVHEITKNLKNWTQEDFDKALKIYRDNESESEYVKCPDYRKLLKHSDKKPEANRWQNEQLLWRIFFHEVELLGWKRAVRNYTGEVASEEAWELKQFLTSPRININENSIPYFCFDSRMRLVLQQELVRNPQA